MDFSTMVLTMYVPADEGPEADERVIDVAVEQSLTAAELGFNPWFTEHHFRGPWHSNPLQFAAFVLPQMPADRYLGFGVLSVPYYHPVRLVESMNLLDQLSKGRVLYGMGSGFGGTEPLGLGVEADYHGSGKAAQEALAVMQRLWAFESGDPEFAFETPIYRGTIKRRIVPAPYRKRHPLIIRTASRDAAIVTAAQNGWPAFIGTFGSESPLEEQFRLYRETLAQANHPADVVEECLRWCTVDLLSVVVAETDAEAHERAAIAKAEALAIRQRFVAKNGGIDGPVIRKKTGESIASAFASGGDMLETIAGSAETVAARISELRDLGINHVLVRFIGEWTGTTRSIAEDSMRRFAREIMPQFAAEPAVACST